MDGNIAQSEVAAKEAPDVHPGLRVAATDRISFEKAAGSDDPAIRRLLRESPFAGDISVSLETEPDHSAAASVLGKDHYTIVARDEERVVCAGTVSTRQRFINGQPTRVGYLSGLRLDKSCRPGVSIIRDGYRFFRKLHEPGGPSIYLTSIVADNMPARRLLERGLPGMPTYKVIDEFVTLIVPVCRRSNNPALAKARRQGFQVRRARWQDLEQLTEFINASNSRYQFAPKWTSEDLCAAGLRPNHFRLGFHDKKLVACAAVWDQRSFRQTVVRGYSDRVSRWGWLSKVIPGVPRLPRVGVPLAQAMVCHTAIKSGYERLLPLLISGLQTPARSRGLDYLVVGFSARDSRLPLVYGQTGGRKYLSRLYAVYWPEDAGIAAALDGRPAAPEVALL